ncbi:MAG: N-acyl-D-glucosamine 2-epimerase, partial [Clostridia bacterium]|nr:N-acyl-D-glucosamine 2-epimerase [Clostridia bacterium]
HGVDTDGGVFDEGHFGGGIVIPNKVWWAQAEGVVGSVNAWQLTKDEKYLDAACKTWEYIKAQVINGPAAEWLASGKNSPDEENSIFLCGPWKCPYHNARAAFEICERAERI